MTRRHAFSSGLAALLLCLLLTALVARPSAGQMGGSGSYYCGCFNWSGPGAISAGDPVELWRGAVEWTQTDLAVGGPVPLRLRRHLLTLDSSNGPFGVGSSMDYDAFVVTGIHGSPLPELILPKNRHSLFTPVMYGTGM